MDKTTFEVRLAHWIEVVKQCQSRPSGQTISQWCTEAGIAVKTYYYWQRKVRRQAIEQMRSPLPPVPVEPSSITFAEVGFSSEQAQDQTSSANEEHTMSFHPDVLIKKGALVIGITNKASDRILNRILQEVPHAG